MRGQEKVKKISMRHAAGRRQTGFQPIEKIESAATEVRRRPKSKFADKLITIRVEFSARFAAELGESSDDREPRSAPLPSWRLPTYIRMAARKARLWR